MDHVKYHYCDFCDNKYERTTMKFFFSVINSNSSIFKAGTKTKQRRFASQALYVIAKKMKKKKERNKRKVIVVKAPRRHFNNASAL